MLQTEKSGAYPDWSGLVLAVSGLGLVAERLVTRGLVNIPASSISTYALNGLRNTDQQAPTYTLQKRYRICTVYLLTFTQVSRLTANVDGLDLRTDTTFINKND